MHTRQSLLRPHCLQPLSTMLISQGTAGLADRSLAMPRVFWVQGCKSHAIIARVSKKNKLFASFRVKTPCTLLSMHAVCHAGLPRRDGKTGSFIFEDTKEFRPNLSPEEIVRTGSFGGTYFRDIKLKETGEWYKDAWKEFEADGWFEGLDIDLMVASPIYRKEVNRYKVKCGQSLAEWESKGWINPKYDSHGWFHWYCRFFKGRRCPDDDRQIARWKGIAGLQGRWRNNLIAKCVRAGRTWDDFSVSPVVRQTLQHWAYRLSERDFEKYAAKVRKGARTSFIQQHTMKHVVQNANSEDQEEQERSSQKKRHGSSTSEVHLDEVGPIAPLVKRKRGVR